MSTATTQRLGVGVLGAGPVTQAIHLPTLARLTEQFHVAVVMDVVADLAARVAARADARATTDQDAVLEAPDVDVVLICSPPQFHAAQVEAACAPGVRAILCEKPLASSPAEAEQIARFAAASEVLRSTINYTLPVGLQTFFQQNATDWEPVMATALIMMLPPIIVFAALNRFFSVGGIGGSLAGR